jgi:hypothetical protein
MSSSNTIRSLPSKPVGSNYCISLLACTIRWWSDTLWISKNITTQIIVVFFFQFRSWLAWWCLFGNWTFDILLYDHHVYIYSLFFFSSGDKYITLKYLCRYLNTYEGVRLWPCLNLFRHSPQLLCSFCCHITFLASPCLLCSFCWHMMFLASLPIDGQFWDLKNEEDCLWGHFTFFASFFCLFVFFGFWTNPFHSF